MLIDAAALPHFTLVEGYHLKQVLADEMAEDAFQQGPVDWEKLKTEDFMHVHRL